MRAILPPTYATDHGRMFHGSSETLLKSVVKPKAQLVLTSPPFPLNRKKRYGNREGQAYIEWIARYAPLLKSVLQENGSIVVEMGNAWEPGRPAMSTLSLRALMAFMDAGNLTLCQQFVCYNPARLPGPAQWVNVQRIRVKDAYTHVWWFAATDHPKANNRNVLNDYSRSMENLLRSKTYNWGARPSEHMIGEHSFLRDNRGAIPSNVLIYSNTGADRYVSACRAAGIVPHPARMPSRLARFFIRFLTDPGDLVLDPFAGSNLTGAAAEDLGRKWVSIEADAGYVRSSSLRFNKVEWADGCALDA